MRFFHFVSLMAAVSIAPLTPLTAQTPSEPDSNQMTIHVTVTARNGDPVEGLTKDDFTLTDNKQQEPITDFHALTNVTTGIVIVLDAVNVPFNQVSFTRTQLGQFFSSHPHLSQPVALGVLEDSGLKMQPGFTNDGNALRSQLDNYSIGLRELTRASGFYGAQERLQISLSMFTGLIGQLPREGMKRIIWISPGWPLLSGPGVELTNSQSAQIFSNVVAITTELERSHIIVDSINPIGASEDLGRTNYYETFLRAPRSSRDTQLGQLGVQVIAQQSGGLVLNGSNDITVLIQRAMAQATGGYELTFAAAPGERENEYHELQLKVHRPGLTVHTIAGYYARPVFREFPRSEVSP